MEWVKVTDRLPAESGYYLTAHVDEDGLIFYYVEAYSAKHKAFNAFDCLDEAPHATEVDYWRPIPPLGGGRK